MATTPAADESVPHCIFVTGWAEEIAATYARVRYLVEAFDAAMHPTLFLFESKRGDAVFLEQLPGCEQAEVKHGQGHLLTPAASCSSVDLLRQFSDSNNQMTTVNVIRLRDQQPVHALTLSKHFPKSSLTPAALIACGVWTERPQPTPLLSVPFAELSNVRHIFAYGTLRHDDTSGASWTKPFNEGMMSEPAVVRGVSLYIQGFPIVMIPRDESQPNDGVVGCVAYCSTWEEFSQKLALADRIEGSPSNYRRGIVKAELKNGSFVPAFIYYRTPSSIHDMEQLQRSRVASGNYLRRGPLQKFEF